MTTSEWTERGDDKYDLKDYVGAIADYTKAIQEKSTNDTAYFKRGWAKFEINDYEGALADYTKAADLSPLDWSYHYRSGVAKSYLNDHEGVLLDFEQAIKLDKDIVLIPDFLQHRGESKVETGDYSGAIADFTLAIKDNPEDDLAFFLRGWVKLTFLQDYLGAIADYTKTIELDSENRMFYYARGTAKYNIQDYEGAINDFTAAIDIDPDYLEALNDRGYAKALLHDYEGAIDDCTRAILINAEFQHAYESRGFAKLGLKDYLGAIADFTKAIEIDPDYDSAFYFRGVSKYFLEDHKEALVDLAKAVEMNPNHKEAYERMALIYAEFGNISEAVTNYKKAYCLTIDYSEQKKIRQELDKLIPDYNNQFVDLPYQQRKIIAVDNEYTTSSTNAFVVLDKSNLPSAVNFPVGHPIEQELYIVHPFTKNSYMPYADYEDSLFVDRYDEFKFFIQCLGAKSMTVEVVKGSEKSSSIINRRSSDNNDSRSGSVSVGFKVYSGTVNGNSNNSSTSNYDGNKGAAEDLQATRTTTQRYNPTKKPYLPHNLIWFNNEPSWQRLYEQRITGSLLQHSETWSLKSNHSISEKEEISLKSAFKDFLGGSIGINMFSVSGEMSSENTRSIEELVEKTFNKSESIEWSIKIEFEPVENLLEENMGSVSETNKAEVSLVSNKDEQEYMEEVKFMLEYDGAIEDKGRAILERLRTRKGISKERSAELERNLLSYGVLSENEKEYFEEFKAILNDGEITEKERRILSRMANRLGISEERVEELEKLI
ncbi:tetratricopeptide repeat protein [Flavobacterium sp. N502540]|uniref:tetratricopeptide repeat protein n=1 Tax=Flavobacterium sp. N502540 TaxID=2986838 RepID=UPI002224D150|nr:tetratricopeptide repeat protein [Flavobacterium sp. N502540]